MATGERVVFNVFGATEESYEGVSQDPTAANYVGTLLGGSMFGAVDGVHMVMLMKLLGPGYSVLDKGSSIRFQRPGRTTLYTRITIDEQEIESLRAELARSQKLDHAFQVEWTDDAGEVHASIERTIRVRRRPAATDESPAHAGSRQRVAA